MEQFRTEILTRLGDFMDGEQLERVMREIDMVCASYYIARETTALSVVEFVPDIVKNYIASLAVEHKSRGTIDGYRLALVNFFKTVRKPVEQITTNDVRVYLFNYQETRKVKEASLEHLRVIINSFFRWCVDEEYLPRNPASKIKPITVPQKVRHALSTLELERMRAACANPRQKAIVDFLYSTGCRASETCDAMISDVDFEKRTVLIRNGKGGKQRIVYLNSESVVSLRAYLMTRSDDCGFLFVSTRGAHHITSKSLRRAINIIATSAGIEHVHPHILRHTMATVALRNGMPVEQVKECLGHSSIKTTMIYTDIDNTLIAINHERFVS